jgi:aryl-alcohol dehydrogenase-like predicted oxidoreductase
MGRLMRTLGRSGIEVSALGLGCWAIGGPAWRGDSPVGWGDVDDAESLRALQAALDAGITFFDTADAYGAGHSERTLAKAFAGKRDQVVIATKFSSLFDEATGQLVGSDSSPAYIRKACDASLARLGIDSIDLYQFHNGGYELDRAGEVRDTLEDLVKQGKIRFYGWSTDDPERAAFFAEGQHCVSVQHQMNVLNDNADMVALCERIGLASINRGPLAMGLLSGKYNSRSTLPDNDVRGPNAPSWMRYFTDGKPDPALLAMLESVREVLTSNGRTLVQGALAWLWGRSEKTIPIPGFKTVEQAVENAAAMEKGPLDADQMLEIDRILER